MEESQCNLCYSKLAKYICPRCNVPYCSVECYKSVKHLNCSEEFYRECVQNDLASMECNDENRLKMLEILKRNQDFSFDEFENSSDSESDEELLSLEERMENINLDDPESVWANLTNEERSDFLKMASLGNVTSIVPEWKPWWTSRYPIPKVTFVGEPPEEPWKQSCPAVKDVPHVSKLSKVSPSPLVFNNILNVIASYTVIARYFNGEHLSCSDSASLLLKLSTSLSKGNSFDCMEAALACVNLQANDGSCEISIDENLMRSDVSMLALGPNDENATYYLMSALGDVHSILSNSASSKKKSLSTLPSEFNLTSHSYDKKTILLSKKKVEYYQSWTHSCYNSIFDNLKQILSSVNASSNTISVKE